MTRLVPVLVVGLLMAAAGIDLSRALQHGPLALPQVLIEGGVIAAGATFLALVARRAAK